MFDRSSAPAIVLYALFAGLFVALAVVPSEGAAFQGALAACFVSLQLAGLGLCAYAARHPRLGVTERRPWRWMTVWFVVGMVQGAALTVTNPASAAFGDRFTPALLVVLACRILAVPVLIRALTAFLTEPLSREARNKLTLDVMTVLGAAVMVVWYLVIGPSLFHASSAPAAARLFVVVLPVCDAVLLLTVVTVVMHGSVTSARRSLLLLLGGLTVNLGVDLWLTYLLVLRPGETLPRAQILGTLISLGLIVSAAVERCRGGRERRVEVQQRLRAYTTLPYVGLAGGYTLLVVAAAKADVYPWAGLVGGALIMTTGVAGRQLVSLRENHRLVITDPLTGLANRLMFNEQLTRALERLNGLPADRPGRSMAVFHIDLDGFKQINDTHGHEAGDRMLAAFGTLLVSSVRRTDTAARLGGDEFGVVLLDLADRQDAIDVARRLLNECYRNPVLVGGGQHRIRCSIGVAYHDPRDSGQLMPETLLDRADQAMYLAKRDGQVGWTLWNERVADTVVPPQRRHTDIEGTAETGLTLPAVPE